ncbi:beta-glucosidase BglX [Novosphingobium aerophilum]|uniref:Beta-D-glucoside glucohydrolase n=1 Tax=Novosphingobium aerophilum TaxID=2839843 RepID=A0A7X1KAU0_9SPHN|nr:beta-glucosidase BglX [Novosphingobium aerophilum]MBC2650480.1 beta-glucosidase BglX [Novosphingobium aerophilum]
MGLIKDFATSLVLGLAIATASGAGAQTAPPPSDATVDARVDALLGQMTPEEKAGQLSQYFYFTQSPRLATAIERQMAAGQVGAVLFTTDPRLVNRAQRIAIEQSRLKIPLLFGFDVVHGFRTIFPAPIGMAASWDPALVERSQAIAAREARAAGMHWAFGPMVDITLDPRWGRVFEGAGEDPFLGAAMAAAQVRGFQGPYIGAPGHIIAGPKHFAGYGAAMGGRDYDEAEISDSQLHNLYLPPFKAAVEAGAGNIMAAYMALNGVPAAANRWLLTDVLRKEWGFKGWVVSDSGAVASLVTHGVARDDADAALKAFRAGTNMEMIPPGQSATMPAVAAAVTAGTLPVAQLDAAVRPILAAKIRLGLFEQPYVDEARADAVMNDPAHRVAARIAAERSAVLLRNDGAVLPLDRTRLRSLAVIGPLADAARDIMGSWVFDLNHPQARSVLAGIRAKVGPGVRVDHVEGVRIPPRLHPSPMAALERNKPAPPPLDETAGIARAVELARQADAAVLVLGETQEMSGEMASRATFDLPGRQRELLDAVTATGKPVIVVLMTVRPLTIHDSKAPAILDVWYPGSEGAEAVANLLFGDATPGGKLPYTWVRSAAQLPMTYARLPSHDPAKADQRYQEASNAPAWPFGFGLSYTTFAYSRLTVLTPKVRPGEPVSVTVDLTNTGSRPGEEVAQLYLHQRLGEASRPVRQLKGFQRVALKPGETRTLRFTIAPADLRYWNAAQRDWVAEASPFDLWIGGSSAAELGGSFAVAP